MLPHVTASTRRHPCALASHSLKSHKTGPPCLISSLPFTTYPGRSLSIGSAPLHCSATYPGDSTRDYFQKENECENREQRTTLPHLFFLTEVKMEQSEGADSPTPSLAAYMHIYIHIYGCKYAPTSLACSKTVSLSPFLCALIVLGLLL